MKVHCLILGLRSILTRLQGLALENITCHFMKIVSDFNKYNHLWSFDCKLKIVTFNAQ